MQCVTRRQQTYIGVAVLLLGIAAGTGLRGVDIKMLVAIRAAISGEDAGQLIFVASQMTALNTLRVLPLYLGAFVLMEAWVPVTGDWTQRTIGYLIPAALVPGSYVIIRVVFDTPYDFGVPATLSLLGVIGVHALSRFRQGLFIKTATFGMFIFGWQWLGLTPSLAGYGFGNGDLSIELKTAAEFLGQEALLGRWSVLSCALFVTVAFVMAQFMVDYGNHVRLLKRTQEQELALQQAALRHLGARSRSEMQALVHDLKTPLTTVQGLVSLLGMTHADPTAQQYVERVEQSVERMNHMISEILHPETRQVIAGAELVRFLQAHVSGAEATGVRFDVGPNLPVVEVNVVRTTRAIANLIQNAQDAAGSSPAGGAAGVLVRVRSVNGRLRLRIVDRGVGIAQEAMEQLFAPGFSTKDSSGLGLSFAREVIAEQHGGSLRVYSVPDKGTCMVVELLGVSL